MQHARRRRGAADEAETAVPHRRWVSACYCVVVSSHMQLRFGAWQQPAVRRLVAACRDVPSRAARHVTCTSCTISLEPFTCSLSWPCQLHSQLALWLHGLKSTPTQACVVMVAPVQAEPRERMRCSHCVELQGAAVTFAGCEADAVAFEEEQRRDFQEPSGAQAEPLGRSHSVLCVSSDLGSAMLFVCDARDTRPQGAGCWRRCC